MKISTSKIKEIISESIRETYGSDAEFINEAIANQADITGKANACCRMNPGTIFKMCAEICESNRSMYMTCVKLCKCACDRNIQGCCICLEEICSCPKCESICTSYCGC